jgi:hypothetical protein
LPGATKGAKFLFGQVQIRKGLLPETRILKPMDTEGSPGVIDISRGSGPVQMKPQGDLLKEPIFSGRKATDQFPDPGNIIGRKRCPTMQNVCRGSGATGFVITGFVAIHDSSPSRGSGKIQDDFEKPGKNGIKCISNDVSIREPPTLAPRRSMVRKRCP